MNLPIQNPPAGWSVSEINGVLRIERGGTQAKLKTQAIGVCIAAAFMASFVVAIRLWNRAELVDALFGWPTLVVLVPLAAMCVIAWHSYQTTGNDRCFLLEPGKLTIHSRFGRQRDTQTVERSRILRFVRSREDDPEDPAGTMWWLDFDARGSAADPEEIYLGGFSSREEVEWFTLLFERWSGVRVRDEVIQAEPDGEDAATSDENQQH
jgi:hypothetical protein